ncbi:hypothetical protein PO909_000340 [Leuciscus waleckii]
MCDPSTGTCGPPSESFRFLGTNISQDLKTDSYNLARYRVQKALETSHVEDSDENSVRKIIPPRRYREEEIQPRRAQQTQHFQEDSGSSQAEESDEDEERPITQKTKRSMLPEAPRFPSPSSQLQPHQSISANFQNQGSHQQLH